MNTDKFWSKVAKAGPTECWLWTGYVAPSGYGVFAHSKGKAGRAHRLAYSLTHGPIPDGKIVCHTCDVRACCNPGHLWIGTDADNVADRVAKGRSVHQFGAGYSGPRPHGESHGSARLTEATARAILARTDKGSDLAREFGVSETCISRLRRGKTWPHLKAVAAQSPTEQVGMETEGRSAPRNQIMTNNAVTAHYGDPCLYCGQGMEDVAAGACPVRAANTVGSRIEYQMSEDDFGNIVKAITMARLTPVIAIQCGMPRSPQEVANDEWRALGKRLGFDGMSVEPNAKGPRFFTAVATEPGQ